MSHKIVKSRGVMQQTVEVSLDKHIQEKLHSFEVQERRLAKIVEEIADWVGDVEADELKAYHETYKHLPAKFVEVEEDDSESADESAEEVSSE